MREHGRRLSDEEIAARELAMLRQITVRWHVTDDEQYMVKLFQASVQRDGESVTARAFGSKATAPITHAVGALQDAVSQACGDTTHLVRASTSSRAGAAKGERCRRKCSRGGRR